MSKRVAVLGCGYWGKNLVRNFHSLSALAAVCDPSEAGRRLAGEIAPGVAVHEAPDAVFADDSIDGIVIATPASTHADVVTSAIESGKDVLCEKPLALGFEDARYVARLAQERGRILMVGHILEYHAAILKLREIIDAGELGKIRYVYSNRLNLGKLRVEENVLWSFAPHDIAVVLRLVGACPSRVVASGSSFVTSVVHDIAVTQLSFDNDVAAHIFVSWLNPFKEQRLVVVGSEKMATFDDVTKKLVLHDQHVDLENGRPVPVKGDGVEVEFDPPAVTRATQHVEEVDGVEPGIFHQVRLHGEVDCLLAEIVDDVLKD